MPFDFKNAVIYKIVCNDSKIKELYVGSTCSYRSRKSLHKNSTEYPDSPGHTRNLYNFIRENGGWSNFSMIPIFKYTDCKSRMDLKIKQGYYMDLLNSTLNKKIHIQEKKDKTGYIYVRPKIICECGTSVLKQNINKHRTSLKHLKLINSLNL